MASSSSAEKTPRKSGIDPVILGALIVLSLAGAGLSIYLTSHFYELRTGTDSFRSACNIGQAMNCDAVAVSPYAELFAGVPLSSFAAGWYLALLVTCGLAYLDDWRREAIRGALVLAGFAALASIFYFFVMSAVLHTYCLYCLFIDGINLASLGLVLTLRPEGTRTAPIDGARWKVMAGTLAGCLFLAVVALKGMDQLNISGEQITDLANQVLAAPVVSVESGEGLPSIGPRDAPVTIVEFSDFQCPFCRLGALGLNTVLERYAGKVRVVFRNYPLDTSCNRYMQHEGHQFACEAARGGVCADRQGKFEPYYQEVFENQKELGPGKPAELAARAGLNAGDLATCMKSPDVAQSINRDIEEGHRLGIQSTPTFFVNGHRMDGVSPLPVWSRIIETLLKNPAPGA